MWEDMGGSSAEQLDAADLVYRRWLRPRLASGKLLAWVVEERGVAVASGALWPMRIHPRPAHPTGMKLSVRPRARVRARRAAPRR